jgi:NhaA family Na+:H+ antiporter
VPISLKVFLTALAILDDLGAIAVIAIFYTDEISPVWLALSGLMIVLLAVVNWAGLERLVVYLLLGAVLWFVVFQSGVHATLAGVALGFAIPVHRSPGQPDAAASPLHRLEHALHPWVTFLIVPLFGFANAGVPLGKLAVLATPVPLAIAAGLFFGKQFGVFLTVWIAVKMRWARRPEGASFAQIYGVALICGIGFTMSLFIGLLAFPNSPVLQEAVKIGVLLGSIVSGIAGAIVLIMNAPGRARQHHS